MYRAGGASCTLLQPLLDNQVGLKNMENCPKVSIPLEKVTLIFFIYTLPVPYFAQFHFSSIFLIFCCRCYGTNTSRIHPHFGFLLFLFGYLFWIPMIRLQIWYLGPGGYREMVSIFVDQQRPVYEPKCGKGSQPLSIENSCTQEPNKLWRSRVYCYKYVQDSFTSRIFIISVWLPTVFWIPMIRMQIRFLGPGGHKETVVYLG